MQKVVSASIKGQDSFSYRFYTSRFDFFFLLQLVTVNCGIITLQSSIVTQQTMAVTLYCGSEHRVNTHNSISRQLRTIPEKNKPSFRYSEYPAKTTIIVKVFFKDPL